MKFIRGFSALLLNVRGRFPFRISSLSNIIIMPNASQVTRGNNINANGQVQKERCYECDRREDSKYNDEVEIDADS